MEKAERELLEKFTILQFLTPPFFTVFRFSVVSFFVLDFFLLSPPMLFEIVCFLFSCAVKVFLIPPSPDLCFPLSQDLISYDMGLVRGYA